MKRILLSTLAISAIATSTFAQDNHNVANVTKTGYKFEFAGAAADNCPTRIPVYSVPSLTLTDVTAGSIVIDKDGSKQTANAENFAMSLVDPDCNLDTINLTGGITVEVKVNSSVAVPQMLVAVGDGVGYTDMNPILQALTVGDNTFTKTITDYHTWDNKMVDITKIGFVVVGFRTNWDDVDKGGVALISGTFKIDYIKIGSQTGGWLSTFDSQVISGALNIFPSPANDVVNVNFAAKENVTVSLTDITGRVVLSQNVAAGTQNLKFNVSNFSEGMYFVNIAGASGSHTEKLMVK